MALFISLLLLGLASATCELDVTKLNQDPYPAVPGEYVDIVFQVKGVENPDCEDVKFELVEEYPLKLDPNTSPAVYIKGGTFVKDFSSFLIVPYKVRVDEDALDGKNTFKVKYYSNNKNVYQEKTFNLTVADARAEFEVFISEYEAETNILSFEILNIGEHDVEAVTLEIEQQENADVKGSKRQIIGDLDSNEYTSADFEIIPSKGNISVNIYYTDTINKRRQTAVSVPFEPAYFEQRASQKVETPWTTYIFATLLVLLIIYWIYRKRKKRKKRKG